MALIELACSRNLHNHFWSSPHRIMHFPSQTHAHTHTHMLVGAAITCHSYSNYRT